MKWCHSVLLSFDLRLKSYVFIVIEVALLVWVGTFDLSLRLGGNGDIFLHSALDFVVVVQVAVLALALCIDQAVWVWACIGIALAAILVVAMIAHPLGVVLLVQMRALQYLGSPSLYLLVIQRIVIFINLWKFCCLTCIYIYLFAQYSAKFVWHIGITNCFQLDISFLVWALGLVEISLFVSSCGYDINFIRRTMVKVWNRIFILGILLLEMHKIIEGIFRKWISWLRITLNNIEIWIRVSCLLLIFLRIKIFIGCFLFLTVIGD